MKHAEARALVERQARAWENGDASAIVADFAPDGELISPGGRWSGQDALRAVAESVFALTTDRRITVTRVLLDGDQGAIEWTWSEARRADGRRSIVDDAIFFALRDGLIISWREYFDTAAFDDRDDYNNHDPPRQLLSQAVLAGGADAARRPSSTTGRLRSHGARRRYPRTKLIRAPWP